VRRLTERSCRVDLGEARVHVEPVVHGGPALVDQLWRLHLQHVSEGRLERIRSGAVAVKGPPEREPAAVAKDGRHLGQAHLGIDPVEGGRRHHHVEGRRWQLDLLEEAGYHLDLGQPGLEHRDHLWTGFDCRDGRAQPHQIGGGQAGAGAHLEHPRPRAESGRSLHGVVGRGRIGRPSVVAGRHLVERRPPIDPPVLPARVAHGSILEPGEEDMKTVTT
jgi:hypothetical protein